MSPRKKTKTAIDHAFDLISLNEGFRDHVYDDSLGNKTAGYGFTDKKDLHDWTQTAARKRLIEMINQYDYLLQNGRIAEQYKRLHPKQQAALMDLLHQGGTGVLDLMPKFVEYMQNGDTWSAFDEFKWGRKNGKGTTNRDNRRRSYFDPFKPEYFMNERDLVQPTVSTSVNNVIPQDAIVERYDDPNVPRSISWTSAYPKERTLNFQSPIVLPDLYDMIQQNMQNVFVPNQSNIQQPWIAQ